MPVLSTIRQETFARAVAAGQSYRQAALTAGYSARSASCLGSQLMKVPSITERVRELKAARPPIPITRESVLQELTDPMCGRAIAICDQAGQTVGFYIPLKADMTAQTNEF